MLCTCITTEATVNSRKENIKSHGVLECTDQTGADVYLDTLDLYNLADDMDSLESSYKNSLKDTLRQAGQNPSSDNWSDLLNVVENAAGPKMQLSNIIVTHAPVNPKPGKYMCYFALAYDHSSGGAPSVYGPCSASGVTQMPYDVSNEWLRVNEYVADESNTYFWCPK